MRSKFSMPQYLAIQFAKISGFNPIIATASPKNTEYLKSMGATHVLDRKLSTPDLKGEISKITSQPIQYLFDVVGSPETQQTGIEILTSGGQYIVVVRPTVAPGDRKVARVLALRTEEHTKAPLTALYTKFAEFVENGLIKVRTL
jgi:NADPH:quinone reductase-like Zn-dependent oxidoreductase